MERRRPARPARSGSPGGLRGDGRPPVAGSGWVAQTAWGGRPVPAGHAPDPFAPSRLAPDLKGAWFALVAAALVACACGGSGDGDGARDDTGPDRASGQILVADAPEAAALAAHPDGGLLFAERRTGRILRADSGGRVEPVPLAALAVSTGGQRGVLGLAVDGSARVFAAWTEPAGRILVGQVAPGAVRPVWAGPPSADLANGGHLAFDPSGGLVIGIGDLLDRSRLRDPASPHGKLLRLDPDGPPDQTPAVVSAGWNNPFAFTVDGGGRLWVADNHPDDTPERLARGDAGPEAADIAVLPPGTAPSGLAARDDMLIVCGYLTRALLPYRITGSGPPRPAGEPLVADCRLGVVTLADGRLAYSTGKAIRALGP